MEKTSEIEQLLSSNNQLTTINKKLVGANEQAINLVKHTLEKHDKLLKHCGKIYQYLDLKHTKTWEEKESLDILRGLITHATK